VSAQWIPAHGCSAQNLTASTRPGRSSRFSPLFCLDKSKIIYNCSTVFLLQSYFRYSKDQSGWPLPAELSLTELACLKLCEALPPQQLRRQPHRLERATWTSSVAQVAMHPPSNPCYSLQACSPLHSPQSPTVHHLPAQCPCRCRKRVGTVCEAERSRQPVSL